MNHTATRWTLTVRALTFLCLILTFEGCKGVEMASHPDSEEELVFNAEGSIVGDESLEIEFISYTDNVDLRDYQMLVEVQDSKGAYDEILSVVGKVYCGQVNENVRTAKNSIVVNAADLVGSDSTVLRRGEKAYSRCIKVKMPPEVRYASIKCTLQNLTDKQRVQSTPATRWSSQLELRIDRPMCWPNSIKLGSSLRNYSSSSVDLANLAFTYNLYNGEVLLFSHKRSVVNGLVSGGGIQVIRTTHDDITKAKEEASKNPDYFLECILATEEGQKIIAVAKKQVTLNWWPD